MSRIVDRTGQVFGKLTVLEYDSSFKKWVCQCACGNLTRVIVDNLRGGNTTSCGCVRKAQTTHNMSASPEYKTWHGMWQRCTNPRSKHYATYKDRCPPDVWRDFAVFYAELGPRPSPKHSLDRIKNHLPYGPGNCKWSTTLEQSRNRKDNVFLSYRGKTRCLSEWEERYHLPPRTIANRLRLGWSTSKAITTPEKPAVKPLGEGMAGVLSRSLRGVL